jgi:hypothetical protein
VILKLLDKRTLKEAMMLVQLYVLAHPQFRYHSYVDDPKKLALFRNFVGRAIKDQAWGKDEHLLLALTLEGGTCMELAKIGMTLLRLAGIPTGLSTGLVVMGGEVSSAGHVWPEVILPRGEGRWYGEPVEVSGNVLPEAVLEEARRAFAELQKRLATEEPERPQLVETIRSEGPMRWEPASPLNPPLTLEDWKSEVDGIAAELPDEIASVLRSIPERWTESDAETRNRIANWVETFPQLVELEETNWPKTEENVAELILKHWQIQANTRRSFPDMDLKSIREWIRAIPEYFTKARHPDRLQTWARLFERILDKKEVMDPDPDARGTFSASLLPLTAAGLGLQNFFGGQNLPDHPVLGDLNWAGDLAVGVAYVGMVISLWVLINKLERDSNKISDFHKYAKIKIYLTAKERKHLTRICREKILSLINTEMISERNAKELVPLILSQYKGTSPEKGAKPKLDAQILVKIQRNQLLSWSDLPHFGDVSKIPSPLAEAIESAQAEDIDAWTSES